MIREQNSRFDVFLAGLAESLSDSRVGCAGVSPSAKGDLFFDFIISGENYRIVLRPLGISLRDGISEPFMDQRLVLLGENQGAPGMELLKRVAERLGALMNDASLRKWIDRRNRNIFEISFSVQGFLGLFGDTVSLKTPFWRDWRVEEVGDLSGGCFLILLKDGRGGEIDLTFGTSGKGIAEGISILITPIGELVLRRPEAGAGIRKVGEGIRLLRRGSHATGPETALAYLLARGTHAGMSWKTPEQPSGGAGDVGRINTRVSLIENCFRSGVSWRGFASRFFNVWGDIDHFGLTAAIGNYEKINFVAHASRECTYAATFLTKSLKSGTSPWKAVHFFKSIEFDNVFFTDINDSTIIGGGEERLEEALGSARDASPERETVVIGNCDYYMIGDNIGSVCRRCAPASGGKITHLNPPLPGFHEVNSSNWWRDFLNSVDFSGEKGDYSVNLAGFGSYDDPGVMELTFLLNRVGIEVKSVILPNISPAARDNFGKAGITVLFPWHPVIETLARPLGEKGMRTISPAAPYGIKGTIEWLNTVKKATAEAAGGESFRRLTDSAEPVSDDLLKELAGEFAPGFCERRESAKGINIGLVCDAGTVGELLSPGFFFGFDPRGFFNELGFGLKIFVPPEIRSRGLPENSKRLFPDVDVVCFDDGDSYRELFHEHDARIVYCDVCGGRTVKEAGAVPFGVDSLEIGLSGAMSTLRKLLSLSKINIYSRYGALRS